MIVQHPNIHTIPGPHCHHTEDPYIPLLKKVGSVALIAFAAYSDMQLFLPSLALGFAIGVYQNLYCEKKCVVSDVISSCSHGFLEQATGVQLPETISVISAAAFFHHHIDHYPEGGVPLCGIIGGIWFVELMVKALKKNHPEPSVKMADS